MGSGHQVEEGPADLESTEFDRGADEVMGRLENERRFLPSQDLQCFLLGIPRCEGPVVTRFPAPRRTVPQDSRRKTTRHLSSWALALESKPSLRTGRLGGLVEEGPGRGGGRWRYYAVLTGAVRGTTASPDLELGAISGKT